MAYAKGGLWLFSVLISPLQFTFTIKVTLSLIRPISFFFAPAKIVQDSDQKNNKCQVWTECATSPFFQHICHFVKKYIDKFVNNGIRLP